MIEEWHEQQILAGADRAQEIDQAISSAHLVLLLISADFLASDACYDIEMQHALERHRRGEARVIPVIVRPCDWRHSPFAPLQCLPHDSQPIATWSDQDQAFVDIVAGLRSVIKNLSLPKASAPRAVLPAIWNIPYQRNPFFIGREDLLSRLRIQLQSGQPTALSQSPLAISGLGGIGKTQIAVEYAYQFGQEYQAVLWAYAQSNETLLSSYVALAALLNLQEQDEQEQMIIVQVVKQWLQTHTRWLLILDNADDLAVARQFLPPILGGHVLLTTRAQAMGRIARRLEVETLSLEQSALFLLRRAGLLSAEALLVQATEQDRALARTLCEELEGLPLALDQAGAYIEETGCSLADYQQLWRQRRTTLLAERRGLINDHPHPVATTWNLSFERVKQANPAAADLLRVCALLAPDAIPEELFIKGASHLGPHLAAVGTDTYLLHQVREALLSYSLVRRTTSSGAMASSETTALLSIHRLVQVVLKDAMPLQIVSDWAERVVLAVDAAFSKRDTTFPRWSSHCEQLLPHTLAATQLIETYHISRSEAGHLLYVTGFYLEGHARYQEAETLYQRAISIREQLLGPEHPDVATWLTRLGYLYTDQGKHVDAEPLFQRALRIWEEQSGPEHPDMADSLVGLARIYRTQGKDMQAESLYQRSLHIREQQLGPEHLDVAYSLTGLVYLYTDQGKYEQAESLCRRALHIREQQVGADSVATSLENLASIYEKQGKDVQAEPLYQRALYIREQASGPSHRFVARPLSFLAHLYSTQGKYGQAEPLYQRALAVFEQTLGPQHPDVVSYLNTLAWFYSTQGKYEQAEPLYQRALHIREQQVTSNSNDAPAYLQRGYAYLYLKKCEYACADFARCVALQPGNVKAVWMVVYASLSKQHPGIEIAECLEAIGTPDSQRSEAYVCRGVALGLRGKLQEGLTELERALHSDAENENAWFWKGMTCAYLGQSTLAMESIEQALRADLPPILLTPLFWLEQDRPHFYQEYAEPLLKRYELL